jgi:endoglycosylceramidase
MVKEKPMRLKVVVRTVCTAALVVATLSMTTGGASGAREPAAVQAAAVPSPSVARAGSWLVDGSGRVQVWHGFNLVKKTAPFYPSTFSDADADLLTSEGFNVVRLGIIWSALEPEPGAYDDAYLGHEIDLIHLLARHGIRVLVDFHEDLWGAKDVPPGDGAPAWASLGITYLDNFQNFWNDKAASDGVGIQTHFVRAVQHVAQALAGETDVIAYDPFNEPQAGLSSLCVPFFLPCPHFEATELSAFYGRVVAGIRQAGDQHVILLEGTAQPDLAVPAIRLPADPQTGLSFHLYCQLTQLQENSQLQGLCAAQEKNGIAKQTSSARDVLGVPTFVGEWGATDVEADNARVVDLMAAQFLPWTTWAYFGYAKESGNGAADGLLVDDTQPGSEANAKQAKLDALVVPYATAIAGTPTSTAYDRSTGRFGLAYRTAAVPGTTLTSQDTEILLPPRNYPGGYRIAVTGGTASIAGNVATITSDPLAVTVTVTVTRR